MYHTGYYEPNQYTTKEKYYLKETSYQNGVIENEENQLQGLSSIDMYMNVKQQSN